MASYDFDLLTIGGGSGGVSGSRRAAEYGARVGLIEMGRVGGTCVLRGCIPKKILVFASHYAEEFADAEGFGWTVGERRLDWARLIESKDRELDRLNEIYENLLQRSGVHVLRGRATFVDAHTLDVDGRQVTAETIMVATGGWPTVPDIPGAELGITSNEALEINELPRRMIIQGGGYIAVEFAGIFHNAGVEVEIVLRGDRLLRGFDEDVREHLTDTLTAKGIRIRSGCSITALRREADGLHATLGERGEHATDAVLFATGRAPNTKGVGLAEVGVAMNARGAVVVDEWSRSSVANIYAVGDVTDRVNLTPVAIAEARALAETLYNDNPTKIEFSNIPSAVFSQPSVASVGLTEAKAAERGHAVDVYVQNFLPAKHVMAGRRERAFMKLVVDARTDRVLGAHMVGPDAAETMQGFAVAIKAGATKRMIDQTIGIHPSAAEEFVTMREKRAPPVSMPKAAE